MPVESSGKESMLLLGPTSKLVDVFCIEDSLIEANVDWTVVVAVSNTWQTACVLKKQQEFGGAYKVIMINPPDQRCTYTFKLCLSLTKLDDDLPNNDIADGSVATESKEKLEWRKRQ